MEIRIFDRTCFSVILKIEDTVTRQILGTFVKSKKIPSKNAMRDLIDLDVESISNKVLEDRHVQVFVNTNKCDQ
jgi:hypothetical protein